ncbi:MAG: hypothetical protein HZB99_01720 [Candidatus Harrisonbacteria bacterium]|nr:hypothetical protein [Candidatus Harrisonbacteria bacterium]
MGITSIRTQLILAGINLALVVVNLAKKDYGWATFAYVMMILCLFSVGRNK